jgi:uncharacterized protein (TIGR02145 family)
MTMKYTCMILLLISLVSCEWDLVCSYVSEPKKDDRTFCTMPACDCPIDSFEDNSDGFIRRYKAVWIDTFGGNDRTKAGQCWMAENLNVGKKVTNSLEMKNNDTIQKMCNDLVGGCDKIGGYYTFGEATNYSFDTVGVKGICPKGWHIPSRYEWDKLIKPFTDINVFRSKLFVKTSGVGVDESGTGIIKYKYDGVHAFFWSSNTKGGKAVILIAYFDSSGTLVVSHIPPATQDGSITQTNAPKCVRCLKDR